MRDRERERESALSLAMKGSGECETHPSMGLTNSHANTHLAVTLKSTGAKPSIIASEEKVSNWKAHKEKHNERSGVRADRSIWSPWSWCNRKTVWASQNGIRHKTRWQFGVVCFTSAYPVSVWVNTAVARLMQQQQLWQPIATTATES